MIPTAHLIYCELKQNLMIKLIDHDQWHFYKGNTAVYEKSKLTSLTIKINNSIAERINNK